MNISSFGQDQWFSYEIFLFYKLFLGQRIIWPHSNTPVITIRNPDIIQTFGVHWLQEQCNVYKSFAHHLIHCICCCSMQCNLNQRIFFFVRFTYLRQCLHCRKFTASNGYSALYYRFFPFKFL